MVMKLSANLFQMYKKVSHVPRVAGELLKRSWADQTDVQAVWRALMYG